MTFKGICLKKDKIDSLNITCKKREPVKSRSGVFNGFVWKYQRKLFGIGNIRALKSFGGDWKSLKKSVSKNIQIIVKKIFYHLRHRIALKRLASQGTVLFKKKAILIKKFFKEALKKHHQTKRQIKRYSFKKIR